MTRYFTLLLFSLMTTPVLASSYGAELTGKTMVDGDVVTVGDLFTNAGRHTAHVLAPAPKPGERLVLSAQDFARVAKAFGLSWTAPSRMQPFAIERNATLVTVDALQQALASSTLKHDASSNAHFTIDNLDDDIVISGKEKVDLQLTSGKVNPEDERFQAVIQIRRGETVLKDVVVTGMATPMVMVPVLQHALPAGSVIRAEDVIEMATPKNKMAGDALLFKADLVGMTIKRNTQPRMVLKRADIVPPTLVRRNELVTVTYRSGAIILSTKARALNAGTQGDTITLMNVSSNKPFEAKVTGPQQAEVNLDG